MFKKLKNNNEGSIEITRVICYVLLVTVVAFTLDILIVITQNVVTSYEAAYYAEKISIQGGILGDQRNYPSINEATGKNKTPVECYGYKKPCTSCLTNGDMTKKLNKTFGYFNITKQEWSGSFITDREYYFHKDTDLTEANDTRKAANYMSNATIKISTKWQPKFSSWLWGKRSYTITKYVPVVMEYIPQVDTDNSACTSAYGKG